MISIIICSRSKDISYELRQNISSSVGIEHEIIVIDNSDNSHSIFSAYDEGAKRAEGNYLCFMHEDILFHTYGWGEIVERNFTNDNIGLLGVVGGPYLRKGLQSWFDIYMEPYGQVLQHFQDGSSKMVTFHRDNDYGCEAAAIDGLWMCIRRNLFLDGHIRFDESIGKWHCYDLDICMQVWNTGKSVYCCNDIIIEHFSHGDDKTFFLDSLERWLDKWRNYLPILKGMDRYDRRFIYYNECMLNEAFDKYDVALFSESYHNLKDIEPMYLTNSRKIKNFIIKFPILYRINQFCKRHNIFSMVQHAIVNVINYKS